jgi:putative serine protease PepD
MPLRPPGSDAAYRETNGGRSTSQRSFGQPEPQEPRFRPAYPGQAWPTEQPQYRPSYIPPPPADWHQQQARSYTTEPPKVNRIVAIAALVALIIGVLAGAGAATAVVALGGGSGPIID